MPTSSIHSDICWLTSSAYRESTSHVRILLRWHRKIIIRRPPYLAYYIPAYFTVYIFDLRTDHELVLAGDQRSMSCSLEMYTTRVDTVTTYSCFWPAFNIQLTKASCTQDTSYEANMKFPYNSLDSYFCSKTPAAQHELETCTVGSSDLAWRWTQAHWYGWLERKHSD